jgi:hypothetical protein
LSFGFPPVDQSSDGFLGAKVLKSLLKSSCQLPLEFFLTICMLETCACVIQYSIWIIRDVFYRVSDEMPVSGREKVQSTTPTLPANHASKKPATLSKSPFVLHARYSRGTGIK